MECTAPFVEDENWTGVVIKVPSRGVWLAGQDAHGNPTRLCNSMLRHA